MRFINFKKPLIINITDKKYIYISNYLYIFNLNTIKLNYISFRINIKNERKV